MGGDGRGAAVAIRDARPQDVELIYALIVELADYERAREAVTGTPELLRSALFGERPYAEAVLAERSEQVVGFALFHGTFSTWECRPGIWLEDLYVRPDERRSGAGEALFSHVAAVAIDRGGSRMAWAALHWNEPALRFYEKLGARTLDEWRMHRLEGPALARVARSG